MADRSRLRQVLEHLLENAVKYAPPDTAIEIDWRLDEGIVRVEVTDEGPGIPPEWRDRIFEPYARHETATARGSGIGLYAARRLAESMGGQTVVRARALGRGPVRRSRCPRPWRSRSMQRPLREG